MFSNNSTKLELAKSSAPTKFERHDLFFERLPFREQGILSIERVPNTNVMYEFSGKTSVTQFAGKKLDLCIKVTFEFVRDEQTITLRSDDAT